MKKLLTILALALVLCLSVSTVLAEDVTGETKAWTKVTKTTFGDEFTDGGAELIQTASTAKTLIGGILVNVDDIQGQLNNAKYGGLHAEYSLIVLTGIKYKETVVTEYTQEGIKAGDDLYIVAKDADGKVKTEKVKVDGKEVEQTVYEAAKADTPIADAYKKVVTYNYADQGESTVQVRVMVNPHDKKGESTTTTKDGKEMITYTCSVCGKEWEPVAKPDPATCTHEWGWAPVEGKEATCLKDGQEIQTCNICGATTGEPRVVWATGDHKFEYEMNTYVAPTCRPETLGNGGEGSGWYIVNGSIYQKCSVCGKREKHDFWPGDGDFKQFLHDELGYTYDEADRFDVHNYAETIDPATCAHPAQYVKICQRCNNIVRGDYVKDSRPLDEKYVAIDLPTCKTIKAGNFVTFKCVNCGSAYDCHPVITVPITKDNVDEINGGEKTTISDGHVSATIYHTGTLTVTKDAKPYVNGNKENKDVDNATCYDEIWNTYTCSLCEKKAIEKMDYEVEHKWSKWQAGFATEGVTQWKRVCSICGQQEETFAKVAPGEECAEDEHNFVPRYVNGISCRNVPFGWEDDDGNWHHGSYRLEPTIGAKETAWIDVICTKCGKIESTQYIIEHDWQPVAELTVPATCKSTGIGAYKCSVCEQLAVEELALAAHDLTATAAVAPTCSAEGNISFYTCKVCDKIFSDAEGTKEIKLADTKLAKDPEAHKWDDGVVTTEATTEKEGVKTYTCSVCGKTKTEAIAKLVPPTEFTSEFKFDTDTMTLSGKATQKEGTAEAGKVFARVTYFLADGTFIAVSVPVEEDGTFESMCTSDLAHVSVRIVDSAKVRPGEYNYLDK